MLPSLASVFLGVYFFTIKFKIISPQSLNFLGKLSFVLILFLNLLLKNRQLSLVPSGGINFMLSTLARWWQAVARDCRLPCDVSAVSNIVIVKISTSYFVTDVEPRSTGHK